MTPQRKQQIANALHEYVTCKGSQVSASNSLTNVSAATISQVLKNNWEVISEGMWNSIAKQIKVDSDWTFVAETNTSQRIGGFLLDAQEYANVHAIIHREGGSKSSTIAAYVTKNKNAWIISCNEYFNRKTFLSKVLQQMGRDYSGTAAEMIDNIITYISRENQPLIILDEADKLNEQVFSFFITLYNALEDKAGIVMLGTNYLAKRIEKGVRLNKRGYKEIYSRLGRRPIEINMTEKEIYQDVVLICNANGICDEQKIIEIFNDSEGDFRRVKKLVHAIKNRGKEQKKVRL